MAAPNRKILVVENDKEEIARCEAALARHPRASTARISFVNDVLQAMDYMAGATPFNDRTAFPYPNYIFCKMELPGLPGTEFLRWVRQRSEKGKEDAPFYLYSKDLPRWAIEPLMQIGASYFVDAPVHWDSALALII
ncbi:MAG TPA: hypothetical protein VGE41_04170 [Verrucomicrobiae bacterium]